MTSGRAAPQQGVSPQKETAFDRSSRLRIEMSKAMTIDEHQINVELMQQAERYRAAGDEAALATSFRDHATSYLNETLARSEMAIREETDATVKRTEAHIKATTLLDPEVVRARQNQARWKLLASRWDNLVSSLDMRGKMLRQLAQVQVTQHFQAGAVYGGQRAHRDGLAEQTRREVEQDLRRNAEMGFDG